MGGGLYSEKVRELFLQNDREKQEAARDLIFTFLLYYMKLYLYMDEERN